MADNFRILTEKVWVPAEAPFKFQEKIDPRTGVRSYVIGGLILPFNKISRNNVLYNIDSIKEKHKQLIGRPVMYNHLIEGEHLPKGHFIDSYTVDHSDEKHPTAGWYYKADIDPQEKDLIRKLERQDLRHVSIQLVGGKVLERMDGDTGQAYTEAYVADIIEGSVVAAPGFLDTTTMFMEALHKEQAGPIIPITDQGENPNPDTVTGKKQTEAEQMAKLKENDANVDKQAGASIPVAKGDGTPTTPQDVAQNQDTATRMKENEANTDTQAPGVDNAPAAQGTKPDAQGVGQNAPTDVRQPNTKMEKRRREQAEEEEEFEEFKRWKKKEQAEEEEEKKKEQAEEEEKPFKEQYEEDMTMLTEIVEKLKNEVESLKKRVEEMAPQGNTDVPKEEPGEEPQPPMTESARLSNIFVETVKVGEDKEDFNKAVRRILYG